MMKALSRRQEGKSSQRRRSLDSAFFSRLESVERMDSVVEGRRWRRVDVMMAVFGGVDQRFILGEVGNVDGDGDGIYG